ncbi:DegT/DnrJ/EryC1/StrS family aminotransferase [Frigoriflavimonas asaccharolytica]|uniref:dTDP-4-amino-4,6-dideoxygalactose transaminase n=1 Tax=Frigoriflavimonas asaccharolytica TaxID=2735899 RepID=A0A8J8G9G7_9FLAO|nr:DegT/DnrJ/EryC1/StrS family aminotransferase [Frigoriflavimonas asaccharolytica]NRS91705.1 dTDP-4-amino-4,6-dideoxygalactose transaminase [Frigoriflavimonas asaccharolytica]
MKLPKIFLSSPHLQGSELSYIEKAISDNCIAPGGKNTEYFEQEIEKFINHQNICALNSGTAALHLSLILSGVKAGDEVICQTFTFVASANVIKYLGAIPIFVDSEKDTWNMCPVFLENAILDRIKLGKKPKAIITVHGYGMPCDIDEIQKIAQKFEIPLIEDAADALGSTYKNKKCGTFGDFGILSFNGNKIITTSGGGALVCKNNKQKEKAIFLATQARDDAPHYQHSEIGYNYRMSNISAGIGCGQMEVLPQRILQRRANHDFYVDLFKDFAGISVFSEPNENFYSNHWLSAILVDESVAGFSREDLRLKFLEDNIESRPLWKPMHIQPVFADAPYYGTDVAENLFENGLCLPSGSNLSIEDLDRIKKVVDNLRK